MVRQVTEAYAVSLRRACGLVQMSMSTYYYQPKPEGDVPIIAYLFRQLTAQSSLMRQAPVKFAWRSA